MGVQIHIPADEVWPFFYKNKERLTEEMVAIAENEDTKYAVYLTEDNDYPMLSVCKGNADPEYEEGAINWEDCTDVAKHCYARYLFPIVVSYEKTLPQSDDENEEKISLTEQDMQDSIYEREDELELALCDFLQVVLMEDSDGGDIRDTYGIAMVDDILDHILEYLVYEHCLSIYRPMFVIDEETGKEVYMEFPYDDGAPLEEDDEDLTGEGWK